MPLPRSKMSSEDADHKKQTKKKSVLSRWKAKVVITGSHWPQEPVCLRCWVAELYHGPPQPVNAVQQALSRQC